MLYISKYFIVKLIPLVHKVSNKKKCTHLQHDNTVYLNKNKKKYPRHYHAMLGLKCMRH